MTKKPTYEELEQRVKDLAKEVAKLKSIEDDLQLYRKTIETMAEGVYLIRTSDGVIVYTNPKFENMFGYGPGELIGKHVSIVNAPMDKTPEETATEIIQSLKEKKSWSGEVKNIKKDGTSFWCSANVSTFDHVDFQEVWISVHNDITERKEAEKVLQESEKQFGELIQKIQAAVVVHRADTSIAMSNRSAQVLLGLTEDQMLGKIAIDPAWNFFREDNTAMPQEEYPVNRVISTQEPLRNFTVSIYRPSTQDTVWVLVNADPVFDYKENLQQVIVTFMDITEHKKAEEALRESEEKYRSLFENTGTATFVTEEDLTISKVNTKCEELSGYSREEIEGKMKTTDFISPEDLERLTKYHFGRREEVDESTPEYEFNLSDRRGNIKNVYIQVGVIPGTKQSIASIIDITSHKQAAEALRENERFLQSVFDGIQDGISVLDPELNIIRVNQWMDKIYSDQKPLIGKICYEVYQQRKGICPWCPSVKAIKTGEPQSEIVPYPTEEDPKGWFDLSAFPIQDAEDRVAGVIEHVKDITDRKRAEIALRESEEKYRNFIENAPIAMYTIDTKGDFTYGNKKLLEMTGYKKEYWLNKPFHPMVHHEDLEFVINKIQDRMAGKGTADPYEIRIFDSSGKIMWVKINSESIYETDELGNKKLVGMQSFVEDVTERKRAEEALRESEEKYRQLVQHAPAGIYEFDMENIRFINVNDVMCEYTGYKEEEFLELDPFELLTEESKERLNILLDEVFAGNQNPEPIEYKIRDKNNREFWVLVNSRFYFEGGVPKRATAVVHDLTAIRQAEEEKKQLEAQLQQAHKMEAIGTLAGGIAHDFNNILGIILGNTELSMYDVPEWNPARLNLEEIRTASLRAKDVVRQLLSFARKTKLEKKPTNIIPIIKESLRLLRSSIPTSIEIRQNIPKDIDIILADPTQINQVLINICTNADHALPDGGIIEVTLKNVELDEDIADKYPELNPGRYVNLVINDTGHGIAQEDIDRIFDPYFTTKEVDRGTGMGLAVVHGIIKGHNGIILVESELGEGTTFSIFFPVVAKEAVVETEIYETLPTGDERILFVDDEELIVGIGHQILERLGYKVESTTSPIDALGLFRSKPDHFDLVITDLTMPKMTGDKLVKEILKIQPDIPIILCTGFSEKIDEKKAKAIGVSDYIEKPLDMRDYAMKIREVLDVE